MRARRGCVESSRRRVFISRVKLRVAWRMPSTLSPSCCGCTNKRAPFCVGALLSKYDFAVLGGGNVYD